MIRARKAALATSVVAGALALTLGFAAPAQAATPEILVSSNGVVFAPALATNLFAYAGAMVPLDVETASFWVRNPLTTAAQMRVSVSTIAASNPDLAINMKLTSVDVGNGAIQSALIADLAACDVVVSPRAIPAGATIRVDISLEMLDAPGQVAQNQLGALTFLAGMRDAQAGAFPANACDDVGVAIPAIPPTTPAGDPGGLIKTGVDLPYDLFALAAGLIGFGFLMLLRRRRERHEES